MQWTGISVGSQTPCRGAALDVLGVSDTVLLCMSLVMKKHNPSLSKGYESLQSPLAPRGFLTSVLFLCPVHQGLPRGPYLSQQSVGNVWPPLK